MPERPGLFQNLTTGVLALCALIVTGLLIRREFFPPDVPESPPPAQRTVEDWHGYATGGQRAGPLDATVTIVEFADFQCPFCRVVAARLDSLRQEFPAQVAVVYRHFPLPNHPHAEGAAIASECAGDQGRFWEMHDQIFALQDSIGSTDWRHFANRAEIPDSARFARCIATVGRPRLREDIQAGHRFGVRATPTLLINDLEIVGAVSLDSLRSVTRRLVRSGPAGPPR